MARQPGPNALRDEDDTRGTGRVGTSIFRYDDLCPSAPARRSPARLPPKAPAPIAWKRGARAKPELGSAVATTTTTTTEDGKETESSSSTMEVTDLQVTSPMRNCSTPSGYSEVKTYTELPPALDEGRQPHRCVVRLHHRWHERRRARRSSGVIRIGVASIP